MQKILSCPYCNKVPMSFFKKAIVSPSFKYKCSQCGELIVIDKYRSLAIMFAFIIIGKFILEHVESLLVTLSITIPVMLIFYVLLVPFEKVNEQN